MQSASHDPHTWATPRDASAAQGFVSLGYSGVKVGNIIYNNHGIHGRQPPSLLDLLRFDGMNLRQLSITNASADTCRWLIDNDQYRKWRTSIADDHLLWIKGTAGSGKSTLMKHVIHHEINSGAHDLLLSHFFDAQGQSVLEHSVEGMYRTLLVQLLAEIPKTEHELLYPMQCKLQQGHWPLPELERLLNLAILNLNGKRVTIFIDALDESDEDEIRDMVQAVEKLLKGSTTLRFCFASRPYPHITTEAATVLNLEAESAHAEGIQKFIKAHLKIGNTSIAREVEHDLIQMSDGVYLWVCLVVGILNREFDKGRLQSLRNHLHQVPADLQGLYRTVVQLDDGDKDDRLACFQALIAAPYEPSVHELWWKIQLNRQQSIQDIIRADRQISRDDMERFIINISKGLIQISTGLNAFAHYYGKHVRFSHESVRSFGLKHEGFSALENGPLEANFEARTHAAMRKCCSRLVSKELLCWLCQGQPHPINFDALQAAHIISNGILLYLWERMITQALWYHAEKAHAGGIDQIRWLVGFDVQFWLTIVGLYEKCFAKHLGGTPLYPSRPPLYKLTSSLLFILMMNDCETLILSTQTSATLESTRFGLADGGDYPQTPVHAALMEGRNGSVKAILQLYLRYKVPHQPHRNLLRTMAEKIKEDLTTLQPAPGAAYHFSYTQALLTLADRFPDFAVFLLLSHVKMKSATTFALGSVFTAAQKGFAGCIELLLRDSIECEALDPCHLETVYWARRNGFHDLADQIAARCKNGEASAKWPDMTMANDKEHAILDSLKELQAMVELYRR